MHISSQHEDRENQKICGREGNIDDGDIFISDLERYLGNTCSILRGRSWHLAGIAEKAPSTGSGFYVLVLDAAIKIAACLSGTKERITKYVPASEIKDSHLCLRMHMRRLCAKALYNDKEDQGEKKVAEKKFIHSWSVGRA